MRPKYSSIVSILCAMVYAASIGIAAGRIGASISERKERAMEEFRQLADRTSSAAVLGFLDQPFREALRDGLEGSATLKALILSGPSGGEYAVETAPGYLSWESGEPRFVDRFGVSKVPLVSPLKIEGMRNVTLSAVSEEIDRPLLASILFNTLGAILIALLVAAGMLLVDLAKDPEKRRLSRTARTGGDEGSDGEDEGQEDRSATKERDVPVSEEEAFDIPAIDPGICAEVEATAQAESAPESAPADSSPRGLYTPRGNISWEAYTKERLSSELHRCASFEQDLVLMGIEAQSPEGMDSLFIEFAAMATAFFTFRDLIFERGPVGISIILPNIDLDHGFRMAEEFRHKVATRTSTPGFATIDLRIGLSSRSGRLVDPDRLLIETERALQKAKEDAESPIVAFKSDPERYRQFLAAQA